MLFPEAKDAGGTTYREGIVRVPSCREHNEAFSLDDEYFCAVMTMGEGTNQIGNTQFVTKIMRAMTLSKGLAGAVLRDVRVSGAGGEEDTATFAIDLDRWERSIRKLTAGLYHHVTGHRLPDWTIMTVVSPDLALEGARLRPYARIRGYIDSLTQWRELRSGPPDVYRARHIIDPLRMRHFVFEHVFYGGVRAWVVSAPEDALWTPLCGARGGVASTSLPGGPE